MRVCYSDFTHTIYDYFALLKKREVVYEMLIPIVVAALFCVFSSDVLPTDHEDLSAYFNSFVSLLINVFAILVGFTIAAVAIFTTIRHEDNEILNKTNSERILHGNAVTNFRFVYVNFIYSAFSSILMLIFALSCYIMNLIIYEKYLITALIFGSLHVLFLSLRNITTLYFSFAYPKKNSPPK